jgi:hypothetical protein
LDRRVIAVDIRNLKQVDLQWVIRHALPFPLTALTRDEKLELVRELASIESVNLNPALEHGPWAAHLIEADEAIFNVLPHRSDTTTGELTFNDLPVFELRKAFRQDQQVLRNTTFAGEPDLAPRKSVLTLGDAMLRCQGNVVVVDTHLSYAVYQGDKLMQYTSDWLTNHSADIVARAPPLREARRFAALQAIFRSVFLAEKAAVPASLLVNPPEPTFTPKFLCSRSRQFTDDCAFKVLGRTYN